MKEKETEPEIIFIARMRLNGKEARTEKPTQRTLVAFVRGVDEESVRRRLEAMRLPGTFEIEPAHLCREDVLTREILRLARDNRFEFGLRALDEAGE